MKNFIKNDYLRVFLIAFLIFAVSVIPGIITNGGIWMYYGDFNVQQIPFYIHAHDAIRNGNLFYDWGVDLGGSLLGCFSFYLMGSPFFWLTLPFESSALPYLMPWLAVLKYAIMATCAFAYAKRHLKTYTGAFVAAFLYTFSGFQGAVLVYNHFHEVFAFFPLYLLLFEKAMEEKKRLPFILMTSFMAILNYYFFVGEVVFLVIYYFAKYVVSGESVKYKITLLFRALYCGVTGVLLACVYLFPAVYYTLHSSRVSDTLTGYHLLAYEEPMAILAIVKNTVMLPDLSGLNSMYNLSFGRVSGVAAYIPLFSVSFVIAFFLINKGKKMWEKRVLLTCIVFACVPFLNAIFSAMNNEYYARWFYMPILMMALMTASVIETSEMRVANKEFFIKGTIVTTVITACISITSVFPAETSDGAKTVLGALKNPEQLILQIAFSAIMIVICFLYVVFILARKDFFTRLVVVIACFITTITMFISGCVLINGDRKSSFINQALKSESPLPYDDGEFYRIETEEDVYNYPLMWDAHSITSFISTIPSSTIDFYNGFGVRRKVTSNLSVNKLGLRTMLSGKYFIKENETAIERIGRIDDMVDLAGYSLVGEKNGFGIYENENYLPMGFSFSSYITESELEEAEFSAAVKDRLSVKTLVLNDEVSEKYSDLLTHAETKEFNQTSYSSFVIACDARRETACSDFKATTNGFSATSHLNKEGVLLFTVPYESGFEAFVDGEATDIDIADYGFMLIKVPAGEHKVEFVYTLSDLKYGKVLSIAGIASLLLGLCMIHLFERIKENKKKETENA